jgi:hypothetical protein
MATKIMSTTIIKQLVKDFKSEGYDLVQTSETLVVTLDGITIFEALHASNGKTWLARYDSKLLTEEA